MRNATQIPAKYVQFFKDVSKLAQKAELSRFEFTVQPGWQSEWTAELVGYWERGRHGEEEDRIHISSTLRVSTDVKTSVRET